MDAPPLYGTPVLESSSLWPAPACAALLPKLILHDPFTLFSYHSRSRYLEVGPPSSVHNKLMHILFATSHYTDGGFTAHNNHIFGWVLKISLYM